MWPPLGTAINPPLLNGHAYRPPKTLSAVAAPQVSLSAAHSMADIEELVGALRDCGVPFQRAAEAQQGGRAAQQQQWQPAACSEAVVMPLLSEGVHSKL